MARRRTKKVDPRTRLERQRREAERNAIVALRRLAKAHRKVLSSGLMNRVLPGSVDSRDVATFADDVHKSALAHQALRCLEQSAY